MNLTSAGYGNRRNSEVSTSDSSKTPQVSNVQQYNSNKEFSNIFDPNSVFDYTRNQIQYSGPRQYITPVYYPKQNKEPVYDQTYRLVYSQIKKPEIDRNYGKQEYDQPYQYQPEDKQTYGFKSSYDRSDRKKMGPQFTTIDKLFYPKGQVASRIKNNEPSRHTVTVRPIQDYRKLSVNEIVSQKTTF